jgi:hypothetical protein
MECLDCGDTTHPRLRHPSSFRTEASVWGLALVIGLSIGAWHTVTTSSDAGQFSFSALSAVSEAPEQANIVSHDHGAPKNVVLQVGGWLIDRLVEFVRVAWWTLPIPLLFSVWRQATKRPICAHCGSRRLIPADLAG